MNQVYSAASGKKRGVAILINRTLTFCLETVTEDKLGRFLMIEGTTGEGQIYVLNVYGPNENDQIFSKK